MSKNNSPQTRPSSVRRRRPKQQTPAPAPKVEVKQTKLRRFLPAILIPHGVAVLLMVVAAVAALMFSAASMVALPATIAQLWLALNMSAVSGSGEVIGVIPMLPAILLVWAVARRVHAAVKKRVSIADLGVLTALVLAIPLSLTGIASAMLHDASGVLDVDIPPAPAMLGRVLLLHLTALVLGMGPRLWRALARRYRVAEWLVDSVSLAIRFLLTYGAVSLAAAIAVIAVNYQAFIDTLTGYEEASAVPALLVLSLLYLPNVVVFAMGLLVGAPLYFGDASISVFSVTMVSLPPLPVLAAIPASAPQWAVVLLLIPAVVAAWVYIKNPMRLVVTMAAAVFGALFFLVLCLLAGGPLGVYGYVGLNLPPAAGMIFVYLLLVGLLITWIDRLRSSAKVPGTPERDEELIDAPPAAAETGEVDVASDPADPADIEETQDREETADDGEEEVAVYIEPELESERAPDQEPEETSSDLPEGDPETTVGETNDGSKPDDR